VVQILCPSAEGDIL